MPLLQRCADVILVARATTGVVTGVSKCNRTWNPNDDKTNTAIWYCNHCKIIVSNGDVKLINKNNIEVVNRIFFGGSAHENVKIHTLVCMGVKTGFQTRRP